MNAFTTPRICKANQIIGRTLVFRDVTTADADFILALRINEHKGKHLSSTNPELNKQIAWLEAYACKTNEAYFIIENKDSEKLGTVRLYDQQDNSFCWGSWILKDGVPQSAAIESALMVYSYAIDHLGFRQAHFDVRKGNENVWRFHERFGAMRVGETEHDYLYQITMEAISVSRQRYRKYLPKPVVENIENEH